MKLSLGYGYTPPSIRQVLQQRLIMTPKIPKNINPEELLKKALEIASKSKTI